MAKPFLRVLGGLVAAFIIQGVVRSGFHRAVGNQMLANWTPGRVPPTNYMAATLIAALVASLLAGIIAALIVRRNRIRIAFGYGLLFTILAVASNPTLFADPHPYEWPLVLMPLLGMPAGAFAITRFVPPAPLPTDSRLPSGSP